MNRDARIFVAGHRGLVGSAITRCLRNRGYDNLLLRDRAALDLTNQGAVDAFFTQCRPEYVFLAAAKVGGIHANNTYPADFLRDNLLVQTHVIDAAYRSGTRKLLFLGSSCIYPRLAAQPIAEQALLTGPLEPTNQWYAIAKIAGIKMCQAYRRQYGFKAIAAMPSNLYGPGDNFDLENSHVVPALLRKLHEAKTAGRPEVVIWGTGTPRREFLFVDDLADAAVFVMEHYDEEEPINVGVASDVTIRELAEIIARVTEFEGAMRFDSSRPDGTPRKLLDTSKLTKLGWRAKTPLLDGVRSTYAWYVENQQSARAN